MNNFDRSKTLLLVLMALCLIVLGGCYASTPTIESSDSNLYPEYPSASVAVSTEAVVTDSPALIGEDATPEPGIITISTSTPILISTNVIQSVTPIPRTPTPVPSSAPTYTPTPSVLKKGVNGDAVRDLQRKLRSLGFYKGDVDGDFGVNTENAVKRFQNQYGLTVDGIAGSRTLQALSNAKYTAAPTATPTPKPTSAPVYSENTYLRNGDKSSLVRKMQDRLIELGYLTGSSTGTFDNATEAGVRAFQNRNTSYTDGVAGKMTLDALFSAKARTTTTPAGVIGISLQPGMYGDAIKAVQTRLKSLGYYTGRADGNYGDATEAAVRTFQSLNGLKVDGKCGSGTLNAIFAQDALTFKQAGGSSSSRVTLPPSARNVTLPPATPRVTLPPATPRVTLPPATPRVTLPPATPRVTLPPVTLPPATARVTLPPVTLPPATPRVTLPPITLPPATPRVTIPPITLPPVTAPNGGGTYRTVTPAPDGDYVTLQLGDQGPLVMRLQQALKNLGYYTGTVDGFYGEGTMSAVKAFQRVKGLNTDGKAGPATQRVLFEGDFPNEA